MKFKKSQTLTLIVISLCMGACFHSSKRELPKTYHESKEICRLPVSILEKVHFHFASTELRKQSYPILNDIAHIILSNQGEFSYIRIEGHTDFIETKRKYYKGKIPLSKLRALNVKSYLIRQGVPAHLLKIEYYQGDRPIDTNETASGRAHNRRVEFHGE